jgi:hypothetical protein
LQLLLALLLRSEEVQLSAPPPPRQHLKQARAGGKQARAQRHA